MSEPGAERRLAAIVAIDVVGYSRLMGADEVGTLATLKAHRAVTDRISEKHGGRIVGTAGDGLLLEFPSVVAAVTFAVETQGVMAERNANIADDLQMLYRIGINLGDVLVDGEDIYGDGVNVAARIEALAEPGGVCVSRTVRDNVRDKMDVAFDDMGEVEVKNITRPVRVFRVLREGETAAPAARPKPRMGFVATTVAIVIAIAGGGTWWWQAQQPEITPADPTKMAYALPEKPPLPLPDKPSIAVLPFDNLSGDPEQEYFADGITEDIITDLSKVSGLFVIARKSSFSYKGKAVKVQDVARDLGVRYVLEGSVRRAGSTLRINTQLIDASTGNHLWAERYDGQMTDVFALQDRIREQVVGALSISVSVAEQSRALRKPTNNLDAYDFVLRGMNFHRRFTKENNRKAMEMFERAIELDPDYADAYAGLAWSHVHEMNFEWSDDPVASLGFAHKYATKAIELDYTLGKAHMVLGEALVWSRQQDEAVAAGQQAVALNPNNADAHMMLAVFLGFQGSGEDAVASAQHALRLNPNGDWPYYWALGRGHFTTGNYAEAAKAFEIATRIAPNTGVGFISLISTYGQLGRREYAQSALRRYEEITGYKVTIKGTAFLPFKEPSDLEAVVEGMRKAGVPEE